MKNLYIVARAHMDPIWLRCFTGHYTLEELGGVVRPYADVEELEILEYMDFAERYGVKYQIEQALTVKKFLERNPDQLERFRTLVQKGLIELAGGGETVIDRNLTQGESWARNHLYSTRYYEKTFSHRPRYAITPDIFGLPSQLPQFFRSVGYDALIEFDRVLKNSKPFWRGLDGTLIVLDDRFLQPPAPSLRTADCVKLAPGPACKGEGCRLCEGTGIDVTHNLTRPDKPTVPEDYYHYPSADALLDDLLQTPRDDYYMMIVTEEPRVGDFLYGPLEKAAAKREIAVHYLGFEENHDRWCPGYVEALRAGDTPADMIDTRPEGNPAAAGCYSTYIEIKKANRELEDLLLEAEALAAAVRLNGLPDGTEKTTYCYPEKTIEALWSKMALIQFHDCVTGSHCDAAHEELKRLIREVRRGALNVYQNAAELWCAAHRFDVPEGYYAAVYFNPTAIPAETVRLSLHAPAGTPGVNVFDETGAPLPVFDTKITDMAVGVGVTLSVRADVPAFGWRLFLWKQAESAPAAPLAGDTVENEYFRVQVKDGRICEIYDKKQKRPAFTDAGLDIGTDIGSPWGRSEPERLHTRLNADKVLFEKDGAAQRVTLSGSLQAPERGIERLSWRQTAALYPGEAAVRFETELDWDGTNTRVFASASPAFETDGSLYCDVPFGMMRRTAAPAENCMGLCDEWPTLGYAGVTNGSYGAAFLKGGLPAARFTDGALQISLLRALTHLHPKYKKIADVGVHTAQYALTAWDGDFAAGHCQRRSEDYLRQGCTCELTAPGKWRPEAPDASPAPAAGSLLPPVFGSLPANLRLCAFKWAIDGSGPVVRFYESDGLPAALTLPEDLTLLPCSTLEEPTGAPATGSYKFRPFEIATFRLKSEK